MANKKKRKKLNKQIKDAFILSIILCASLFVLNIIISLVSSPVKTYMLTQSIISEEESNVGYVIREEKLIDSTNINSEIKPIKNEGEKVSVGNPVFKYYNVDEEKINKEIEQLNKEIQEALLGKNDLYSSDIKSIENQIEKQIENLKNENNMQNILECKTNIAEYIIKKAKIAGALSNAGEYINNLIIKRNELETTLTEGANYVYSEISGVVSYRIDGLEDKLTKENIDDLKIKDLTQLNLTTAQIVSRTQNEAKVINNFECYVAVPFNKTLDNQIQQRKQCNIKISK